MGEASWNVLTAPPCQAHGQSLLALNLPTPGSSGMGSGEVQAQIERWSPPAGLIHD